MRRHGPPPWGWHDRPTFAGRRRIPPPAIRRMGCAFAGLIVLAAINLINIPLGTILGAYGLWVLLNKETERLFAGTPPASV